MLTLSRLASLASESLQHVSFLSASLLFLHDTMFRLVLYFSLPRPQNQNQNQGFLQGALVALSGEWYLTAKVCLLGVLIGPGVLLLPGVSEHRKTTLDYTDASICFCKSIFIEIHEFVPVSPIPSYHHNVCSNFLLLKSNLAPIILSVLVYLINSLIRI